MKDAAMKAAYDAQRYAAGLTTRQRRTKGFRKDELYRTTTVGDPLPAPAIPLKIRVPRDGLKIAFLPDGQTGPGRPDEHWAWAGEYLADKRPDVIVNIGDFADMNSLGTHDKAGSIQKEGKRYRADIDAAKRAMDKFMTPIARVSGYDPYLELTYGNHEHRIIRAVEDNPVLEGTIGLADLRYADWGWRCHDFLQPVIIGGVAFSHFFPGGVMGKPITSPAMLIAKQHMSCVAGHLQGRQVAYARRADGMEMTAIISGSFYQHKEEYLSPLTNIHFRGMWMLHEVKDGSFDEMAVSINFLRRKFA